MYDAITKKLIKIRVHLHNLKGNCDNISEIYNILNLCNNEIEALPFDSTIRIVLSLYVSKMYILLKNFCFEQAYNLTDAIHGYPEAITFPNKDMLKFWKTYFMSYQKKWTDNIFDDFKNQIISS